MLDGNIDLGVETLTGLSTIRAYRSSTGRTFPTVHEFGIVRIDPSMTWNMVSTWRIEPTSWQSQCSSGWPFDWSCLPTSWCSELRCLALVLDIPSASPYSVSFCRIRFLASPYHTRRRFQLNIVIATQMFCMSPADGSTSCPLIFP